MLRLARLYRRLELPGVVCLYPRLEMDMGVMLFVLTYFRHLQV